MEESQLNSNLDPNLMQFDLGYHQHSDQPNKIQAHSQEEQTHRKQPDSHEKLSTQEQLVAQDKQLDQQQPFNISEQNKTHDELNSSTIQQDQLIIHQQNIITLQEMPTKQSHHETSEPRAASQEQPSHPSSSPAIPHVDSGNGSNMINMEKSNQSVNDPGNIDPSAVQMVEQEMVKPICLKSLKKTEESKEEVAQPIKKNEDSVSSGLQPAEEKNKLDESKLQLVEQEKSLQSVGLSEKVNQPVLELMEKQEKLDESVPQPVERNEASVEPVLQLVKKREELVEPVLQRVKSVTLNESVLQSVEKNPQFVQLVVIQPVTKGEQLVEPVLQPVIKSVSDELVLQPIENKEEVREQPMEKKNEELREPILQPVEKDQDLLEPVLQPAKKNEALVDPVLQPVNNVTSNQSVHQPIEKNEESREQIHQPVEKNQVLVEPVLQPLFADPVLHPVIKVTSDEPVLQPMEKNEELREPSLQLVEKNEESVEPVIQPVKKNEKSVDSVLHPVIKVTSDESVLQPTKKKEKIDEPVLQPVEKNVLQPVEKNEQVTTNKSVVDPVLQPVRHVTLEKSAPQPLEKQEEAGESVFQTVEKNKQVVEPVLQLVKKNQEVVDPQEFVDPMLQPVKNVKLNQPIFQPIEKREKPGESIRQPVQKSEKLVETVFQQVDKNEKSGDSVLLPIKKDMTNTLLKPLEIILPTNRFLFPEYEQSLRFDLTQLQCLDRMRQETQNSKDNAPPHLVVSVGKIPSPPGTRAGQPFEDGFTCLISPSSPTHSDIQPESINYERSNQIDPSLLPSSSHVPHRRVGRPRKSAVPYVVPKSTTQPRQSALDKKIEENKPVIGLASQPIKEKPRTNTRSSMVTRATTSSSGQQQGGGQSSSAHVISETAGPSNLSRKKEPWLTALKATYAANKRKYSKLIVPYPQVGDSFKTIENFKEGCLLASWAAGHDMHVRNHYKTDLWERCVFTCRHDRSPPKGLNCPFKIVAMGNRVDMKPGQPVESWKVIKSHPVHGNHEVGPGAFDPLGKRTYRKRGAADSIAEGQEAGGQQSTESMQPSRKRRKPRRSSERIDQPLLRPKPPPSVALPAPSAVQKVAPKVETPPSPTLDNSSDSDLYFPGDSGHSSASANVLHSRANLQETTS